MQKAVCQTTCAAKACSAGVEPNVHAYTSLMSLCQKAGEWQRAMDIFRRMETADIKADVVAYNSAIAACAKGLDWEQAWAVFASMKGSTSMPAP